MGVNSVRAYLDSCIIIYLVEEHSIYGPKLESHLAKHTDVAIYFSALSEMECLVMPIRNNNQVLNKKFSDWFERAEFLPLEREIFLRAAGLRATYPTLKTPDAIHLATALYHGCAEFWTNDDRLTKIAPQIVKNVIN